MKALTAFSLAAFLFVSHLNASAQTPSKLRIGRAGHAFDHAGQIAAQAEAAAASGATIIYATDLGAFGYQG